MKKFLSVRLTIFVVIALFISNIVSAATGSFINTSNGIRFAYKTADGMTKYIVPKYDTKTGTYYVVNNQNKIVAQQKLSSEGSMNQIKVVTGVDAFNDVTTKDFMGNDVPVLTSISSSDPRYQQLKTYIESNDNLQKTISMQIQARDYKINKIQEELKSGSVDSAMAEWLTNDLKKPLYIEVDNSGAICHDASGFVLAESSSNGQTTYRDNSYVNRVILSDSCEMFNGNSSDPTAASIMSHELGHMIMDQLYETPNYPKTEYFGSHSKNTVTDEGFAISEGWAEALEALSTKDYRANNGTDASWRLKTQNNIENNMYIYEGAGVTNVTNNGLLKTANDMLSTEGVNASLFYDMLDSSDIQNSYGKICQVFEESKPQTYREFVYDYIEKFPEDTSTVTKMFLEDTKYTTVDSTAAARYKDLYDAEQAYLTAPDEATRANLKIRYEAKKQAYEDYNESIYKQAVVDKTIDSNVVANGDTNSSYRAARLSETWQKTKSALDTGLRNAGDSIKSSFSVKNVAMTAGTSIAINLASQLMNGEKVSLKTAAQAVASMEFVGNFVGSSLGAAAGHVVAPLVQTFVPGIVGTLAGALIPSVTSLVGGNVGSSLGAGMTIKESFKSLDMVAISGQAIGSMLGSMLGSLIPVPVVGTILGSIVGGIAGEKLFKAVAKLFKRKTPAATAKAPAVDMKEIKNVATANVAVKSTNTSSVSDSMAVRISDELDSIPYSSMSSDMKNLKDEYEKAYKAYVSAIASGDQAKAQNCLKTFRSAKAAYELALRSCSKG